MLFHHYLLHQGHDARFIPSAGPGMEGSHLHLTGPKELGIDPIRDFIEDTFIRRAMGINTPYLSSSRNNCIIRAASPAVFDVPAVPAGGIHVVFELLHQLPGRRPGKILF